jgi:hypothetical protein
MNETMVTLTIQKRIWWSTEKTRQSQITGLINKLEKAGWTVDLTADEDNE